jgi:phosphopantothenoylcysteine decarboxylase/phosphopantothenate--cysteine ligase
MAEPDEILDAACWLLGRQGPLAGRRVVVTAGGTREPLDPIRFLGNRSSGQMGYALARAARDQGAEVMLITTTSQAPLFGVEHEAVETAAEMRDACLEAVACADVLLMAAAVADYRPPVEAAHKIKKGQEGLTLELVRTPDILVEMAALRRDDQVIVGFAAETENLVDNAQDKLQRKRLDLIVANDARRAMGASMNQVILIGANGAVQELPLLPKEEVAERILDRVAHLLAEK